MDINKLSQQEKEALIDLLWMNQMHHAKYETFVMQNNNREWHFGTQNRDAYNYNSRTGNKIKFRKLTKSNLLLRTILEEGLLHEWVRKRANYVSRHTGTEPTRIYDIIKEGEGMNTYVEFFYTSNSFVHNNKWGKLYQKVYNEITNKIEGES